MPPEPPEPKDEPDPSVARDASAYVVVGGVAFAVDFAIFMVCVGPFGPVVAQTLARIGGGLLGFVGHKLFAFGDARKRPALVAGQLGGYALLWVTSWALSTGAIVLLLEQTGWAPVVVKLMVEPLIVVGNFVAMRTFIFKRSEPGGDA